MAMGLLCTAFLFTSCEDFLAEKTYDFYDEQNFYTNITQLEQAVIRSTKPENDIRTLYVG